MFDKLLRGLIPACVTFGPLFMTRIAETAAPEYGHRLVVSGMLMLVIGLIGIFRIISGQQKMIADLQSRLANGA